MKRNLSLLLVILVATIAVGAQVRPPLPRPSSKAAVMQTIATTDVSIVYSRPAVKGRKVFGDWPTKVEGEATLDDGRVRPEGAPLVPNDHIWRAGANEATLFTIADDVLINGQELKAGKYSLHMIPTKGDWTIIFNSDDGQWGSFSYNKAKDVLRVTTKAEWVADSKEFLSFGFENVGEKSATAFLRWEKAKIPFTIEVKDVIGATISKLKAYVAASKPDDPQPSLNAANYAKANKQTAEATAWYAQAMKLNDAQVATKETFQNLQRKATILIALARMQEALAAAERAVVVGKADSSVTKAQIDALEKRIADIKAGKQ